MTGQEVRLVRVCARPLLITSDAWRAQYYGQDPNYGGGPQFYGVQHQGGWRPVYPPPFPVRLAGSA